ncbi:MAG: ATP-binding cassette domain-containing protein [Gemmatimonas sp.]
MVVAQVAWSISRRVHPRHRRHRLTWIPAATKRGYRQRQQRVGRLTKLAAQVFHATTPAVSGLGLHIRNGELIALVGENGAGKSSLVKLPLRFYDPDVGTVRVGGVDLTHVNASALRDRIGVLFQDYANYELSMRENVLTGRLSKRQAMHGSYRRCAIRVAGRRVSLTAVRFRSVIAHHQFSSSPPPSPARRCSACFVSCFASVYC